MVLKAEPPHRKDRAAGVAARDQAEVPAKVRAKAEVPAKVRAKAEVPAKVRAKAEVPAKAAVGGLR